MTRLVTERKEYVRRRAQRRGLDRSGTWLDCKSSRSTLAGVTAPEFYDAVRCGCPCLVGSVCVMKLNYYPDTDSLYIDLSERRSAGSREVSEGVVLDYDSAGKLVGMDIDNATNKVELKRLILSKLPEKVETAAA